MPLSEPGNTYRNPPGERRAHARLRGIPPVAGAWLRTERTWLPFPVIVTDVSLGGVQLHTDRALVPLDVLRLVLQHPDADPDEEISVQVEVVRVELVPGRVRLLRAGCRFIETSEADRAWLIRLLGDWPQDT